jgi:predicted HD superfamily hydrolase involved in NAD metabolism
MRYNISDLQQKMKLKLDRERYEHTLGVAYLSAALAMKYECDIKKAQIAGLLHDCAKCISDDKKLQKCMKHNISMTAIEKENPYLLHAKLGAFLAMNQYKIEDKEIIGAILNHTTGKPDMTELEKIVFVADYIEPGRDKAKNLDFIRKLAFEDLDRAVYQITKDTLEYLNYKGRAVDQMTVKTYFYYKEKLGIQD